MITLAYHNGQADAPNSPLQVPSKDPALGYQYGNMWHEQKVPSLAILKQPTLGLSTEAQYLYPEAVHWDEHHWQCLL
jgi:hypothetical protein